VASVIDAYASIVAALLAVYALIRGWRLVKELVR
jgi:hypothetical protein